MKIMKGHEGKGGDEGLRDEVSGSLTGFAVDGEHIIAWRLLRLRLR